MAIKSNLISPSRTQEILTNYLNFFEFLNNQIDRNMPTYLWSCHLCNATNHPNTEACSKCGFPAYANGKEIESARSETIAVDSKDLTVQEETSGLSGGSRVFCVLFGLYLLVGAGFTVRDGKWFAGFPPQLDFAYFIFGGTIYGAYIEAFLAAVIGLFLILIALRKEKSNGV